jgi:hypothetical protein
MITDARRIARDHESSPPENVLEAPEHDIRCDFEVYDRSLQAISDGLRLPGIRSVSFPDRSRLWLLLQTRALVLWLSLKRRGRRSCTHSICSEQP